MADAEVLRADHVLEFPYKRSVGPILGRFFTELRDNQRIVGIRTKRGQVIVPPAEVDPDTLEDLSADAIVPVANTGVVKSWTWLSDPRPYSAYKKPHAWALIQLDGADTNMLHAVVVDGEAKMSTGMRVKAVWKDERQGHITDIAHFAPEASK